MTSYIRIVRYAFEEPHHLDLRIAASNGHATGSLQFYVGTQELLKWAKEMGTFPVHARSILLWEYGSERNEDRCVSYFRMRVFAEDLQGHSAIHFRFNNYEDLPDREISEFCIRTDPAPINRLGTLLGEFANLRHEVLEWSPTSGQLRVTCRLASG